MANNPNSTEPRVNPLTRFRETNEFGDVVQSHTNEGSARAKTMKYYTCSVPNASFHRKDGTRLPFINGFFATDVIPSQNYLDQEIEDGNLYLAHATADQVHSFKMHTDPRGTMKAELTPQIEAELREKLEAEIRQQIMNEGFVRTEPTAEPTPSVQQAGERVDIAQQAQESNVKVINQDTKTDAEKLGGVNLANKLATIRAGNATVKPLMESKAAPLGGIVSSASLSGAADSNTTK